MNFYADLHIHSRYAYATSKDCILTYLSLWAKRKGVQILSTGDFTHPLWMSELEQSLIPAEEGLFKLNSENEIAIAELSGDLIEPTRFMLGVEVSSVYSDKNKTRKIHHLIYMPTFEAAHRFSKELSKYGDLKNDGRPTVSLSSRDLLQTVLETNSNGYLIPAHIWTPWFGVLGSQSGYDSIDEAYKELTPQIFALETGLSSDPAMNWTVENLDRYNLVSFSDAHSPQKIAREATSFSCDFTYAAIRDALKTGCGLESTVEFFPEEGKYHYDGHRICNVKFSPLETKECGGICPKCKRKLTVGVLNRVEELSQPHKREASKKLPFKSAIPLIEILSQLEEVGPKSKHVQKMYLALLKALGPELDILLLISNEKIRLAGGDRLARAIQKMRVGLVNKEPGYDGVFGSITVQGDEEIRHSINL